MSTWSCIFLAFVFMRALDLDAIIRPKINYTRQVMHAQAAPPGLVMKVV